MLIKKPSHIKSSEITDKKVYMNRRQFLVSTGLTAASLMSANLFNPENAPAGQKLPIAKRGTFSVDEKPTPYEYAAEYNNFYEFSTKKELPARMAKKFKTRPWTVAVDGKVKKPKVYDIEKILKMFPLEERIYRFRCVEAWSMVVPWLGFPLGDLIKRCEPLSDAKFVKLVTLYDPKQMPGQKRPVLQWPYIEGLRIDEALHPLTLLTAGMYGEVLPNQNGAPLRLIVPWKYGFKSIKSIVKITLTEEMPLTAWNKSIPGEYGFYANVNPDVDHPRWSQAMERPLGKFFKKKTLLFNGYGEEVAGLYSGMDLKRWF